MSDAILSFKLGPVQPFIEAARTLRDLWSGSYLLSWLTANAMKPLLLRTETDGVLKGVTFVTPHVNSQTNPLLRAVMGLPKIVDSDPTLACLPHTFAAVIADGIDADDLRKKCVKECREEWMRIAEAVRKQLPERLRLFIDGKTWKDQIETYFEITCVVRPNQGTQPDTKEWVADEWNKLAELLEMTRTVRHVPAYTPAPDENGRYPVKCSQLGSLEQMGPADFEAARKYWAGLTRKGNDEKPPKSWVGLHGTGLQSSDKLCGVALVKRFMWPAYFAETTDNRLTNRLGVHVHELRFTDTATMAARKWLGEGEPMIDPLAVWEAEGHWSGQWLHWATPNQDDDAICPRLVWDRIEAKKRDSKPPTYFALMHLDGDNMGELFTGDHVPETWENGITRYRRVTELVTTFANAVRDIVKKHHGELIYAGGDDVLAFLPTETVIECARQLREAFRQALGVNASLSGGIAVVHYKEDLRFALGMVRAAEKAAKQIGKTAGDPTVKDALALTICKRSGEHSTVVMGWPEAGMLQPLIAAFVDKASDRWTYKLREELETLKFLPLEAGKAETLRLVGRGEFGGEAKKKAFLAVISNLFDAYQKQMQLPARNWPDADVLIGFVALCQSASFLARGKE